MKDSPLNLQKDINSLLKRIDNLPNTYQDKKTTILINDYYLEFISDKNRINKIISIDKENCGSIIFYKILDLVNDGSISCLVKVNNIWFFTYINVISNDKINITLIKKLENKVEINKIYYLSDTIDKLKNKLVSKKIIRKYISGYFEYLKELEFGKKTFLNYNKAVI